MTATSIAKRRRNSKPAKPRKDYPLFAHANGQWVKKVRGKLHYFGTWDDPVAAEAEWERRKHALLAGHDHARQGDTVGWLCNKFMTRKKRELERGHKAKRTYNDYLAVCKHVADYLGRSRPLDTLVADDFESYRDSLPKTWGAVTTNKHLRLARSLFKYGNDIEATERSLRYGIGLKQVSETIQRKEAAKKPAKEYTAEEIWKLYDAASQPMRAFILLGINCAYSPHDIGQLRIDQIDFDSQWLGVIRGKTGIARGAWLWPETVEALREAIDAKPYAGNNPRLEPLAFITQQRHPWWEDGSTSAPLALAFGKLKKAVGINKKGVGHNALRHTMRTIGGDSRDIEAVEYMMGWKDNSISGKYREGIDPERVKAVCEYVRQWWLAGKPKKKRTATKRKRGAK